MQKVIIDTNVIISALISSHGIPAKIVDELFIEEKIILCISNDVFAEYLDVIDREKFRKYKNFLSKAEIVVGYMEEMAEHFVTAKIYHKLPDKSDNKFIDLAIYSNADFIITGNKNDFNISHIGKTLIVTPTEYWENYKP